MIPAIDAWRVALGADKVDDSSATIDRYARTTLPSATRPCCVLYPTCTEEVQAVVRVAAEHHAVVYPISRGRNWGYGDACAPTDGAAIVDLGRMDRILEVNSELAYTVIEPGVTQGQLNRYLKDNRTGLWMDCTGAGCGASIAGNTLDRGFGHTRYGDHVQTTCGMEIVLADGRVLNTGFGHYANAKAGRVYGYGIGPSLDGLFCQSNLGIVTKIGLWLMPEPEAFSFFFARLERDEDIAPFVDRMRPLRLAGIVQSAVHIGNDYRIFSSRGQYPFDETNGATPLPQSVRERLRKRYGLGAWNVAGALTGTRAHVRASKRAVKRALQGLGGVRFVSDKQLDLAGRVFGALSTFGIARETTRFIASAKPVLAAAMGVPSDLPVRGTYWRLRAEPPAEVLDPIAAGAGLMWASPVLPMRGEDVTRVMRIAEPIFAKHGFEPMATLTLLNDRALIAVLNVYFDKGVPDEAAQAAACHGELIDALAKDGYYPYRAGLDTMPKMVGEGDVFWDVAGAIKDALDPHDIIARGRYLPPRQ
ncbi:MAG: FAD-binding oxidoreductase [Candidatus Hydrogenedentes bacterium]|nr:FAD-binding oxidoreductase [Candidatus Hydrogenedentota bacterium]